MAVKGEIILIDIRRPEEWKSSGVATPALTITMHQNPRAFFNRVHRALGYDMNKPVAIICAVGVRTRYMQAQMKRVGFLNVVDVSEGMIGGKHGTGWIKSGLPIRRWHLSEAVKPVAPKLFPRGSFADGEE